MKLKKIIKKYIKDFLIEEKETIKKVEIKPEEKYIDLPVDKMVTVERSTGDYKEGTIYGKNVYVLKSNGVYILVLPTEETNIKINDNIAFKQSENKHYGSVWNVKAFTDDIETYFHYTIKDIEPDFTDIDMMILK